ncbi:MAG TPA: hypothetical protein VEG65_06135 [Candidatus Bathyarchaeia archaeon]|nr:hypothetical protein [Candidatus Bathyarchaeia archaeon]
MDRRRREGRVSAALVPAAPRPYPNVVLGNSKCIGSGQRNIEIPVFSIQ